MTDKNLPSETWRLSAVDAVGLLKRGEVSPLELVDAAAARIAATDGAINALPILCLDRARDHARRLMERPVAERGLLGGLPIAVKDLNAVAGVRCTQGSPIFADDVPDERIVLIESDDDPVIAEAGRGHMRRRYPGAPCHRLTSGHFPYVTRADRYTAIIADRLLPIAKTA